MDAEKFEVLMDVMRELGDDEPTIPTSELKKLYDLIMRKSFWEYVKKA